MCKRMGLCSWAGFCQSDKCRTPKSPNAIHRYTQLIAVVAVCREPCAMAHGTMSLSRLRWNGTSAGTWVSTLRHSTIVSPKIPKLEECFPGSCSSYITLVLTAQVPLQARLTWANCRFHCLKTNCLGPLGPDFRLAPPSNLLSDSNALRQRLGGRLRISRTSESGQEEIRKRQILWTILNIWDYDISKFNKDDLEYFGI